MIAGAIGEDTWGMFLALLVGAGALLCSLLSCGMGTDLIVRLVVRLIPEGSGDLGFWKSAAVMMIVTLIKVVAHLIGIAL